MYSISFLENRFFLLYNLPGGGKREVEAKGEENMRWKGRQKKRLSWEQIARWALVAHLDGMRQRGSGEKIAQMSAWSSSGLMRQREVEGPSWKDNQTSACSSSGWWHGKEWKDSPNEQQALIWAIWDGKWAKKEGFGAQTSTCRLSGLIEIIRKVDVKGWLRS